MSWVKDRLREYNKGKRALERYRASLIRVNPADQTDAELAEIKILDGMISDMLYAIEWMRTGRRPYGRRGIDITDAYSRALLMDMDLLPILRPEPEQELHVTEQQKRELARIMMLMSDRERQCYLLHMAQGLSFEQIGKEMRITKASVQNYIERAKNKIPAAF